MEYVFEIRSESEDGEDETPQHQINRKQRAARTSRRDRLRYLLLQEAWKDERETNERAITAKNKETTTSSSNDSAHHDAGDGANQFTSHRSHFFETRPGRIWYYEIDAPPGHGADEPMKMVSALGIPPDVNNIGAKLRAIRHRKAKLKGAAAFIMANAAVRKKMHSTTMDYGFDEEDFRRRVAVRVNVEMISLSSDETSISDVGDDVIPMFAPLESSPLPVVEQDRAEATQQFHKRRERRRGSVDALVSSAKQGSSSGLGGNVITTMRGALQSATTQMEGAIGGGVQALGDGMHALEDGVQNLVQDTGRLVRTRSSRFKSFAQFRKPTDDGKTEKK